MTAVTDNPTRTQPQLAHSQSVNDARIAPEKDSLEELARDIRRTLPLPSSISRLELNREAGVVEVTWQSRHFVIKSPREAFELKGKLLYVNGASLLIQAVLEAQEKQGRAANVVSAALEKVEDLFRSRQMEAAYSLLETVKATLHKLACLKSAPIGFDRIARRSSPMLQGATS